MFGLPTSNKTFLEIGSGTGIISLLIGLGSANPESNLATDISTFAVTNTQANFNKYNLKTEGSIILCTSKTIGNWSKILEIAIKHGFSKEPCILAKNEDLKYLNQDSFFDLCLVRFDL